MKGIGNNMRRSTNLHHHALNSLGRITITAPLSETSIKPLPLYNINDIIGNFVLLCTSAPIQYLELDIYRNWTPYNIYCWHGGISLLNAPTLHFPRTVIQCHIKISGNMQIWSRMKTSCCYLISLLSLFEALFLGGEWCLTPTLSIHFNQER